MSKQNRQKRQLSAAAMPTATETTWRQHPNRQHTIKSNVLTPGELVAIHGRNMGVGVGFALVAFMLHVDWLADGDQLYHMGSMALIIPAAGFFTWGVVGFAVLLSRLSAFTPKVLESGVETPVIIPPEARTAPLKRGMRDAVDFPLTRAPKTLEGVTISGASLVAIEERIGEGDYKIVRDPCLLGSDHHAVVGAFRKAKFLEDGTVELNQAGCDWVYNNSAPY